MDVQTTFSQLVQIDSPSCHEQGVRDWLLSWASERNLFSQVDSAGNLIIKRAAKKTLPFFLCAHMDTVEPGKNIVPQIINNTFKSDGTTILGADNKAALAAILVSVDTWMQTNTIGFELVFTVEEETDGGAQFFDVQTITSRTGYIFDYAEPLGKIVIAAPFISNFKIEFLGKGAHACFPEKGINPLPFAAEFLRSMQFGTQDDAQTFVNIGLLQAGTAVNAVPEKVILDGEVRSFSEAQFKKQLTQIEFTLKKINKRYPEVSATFSLSGYCPGYSHEPTSPQIVFIESILKKHAIAPEKKRSFAISDANSFSALGLNVVTLSDGVSNPHTVTESIAVSDLLKMQDIISSMLETATKELSSSHV